METTHETEKLDISDTVAEITNVISKHLTKVIEKVSNKNIDASQNMEILNQLPIVKNLKKENEALQKQFQELQEKYKKTLEELVQVRSKEKITMEITEIDTNPETIPNVSMEEIVNSLKNDTKPITLWGISDITVSDDEDEDAQYLSNGIIDLNNEKNELKQQPKNSEVSAEDERLAIDNWTSFHENKGNVDCTKADNEILIDIMKSSAGIKGWAFTTQPVKHQTKLTKNSFAALDEDEDEDEDDDEDDEDDDEDEEEEEEEDKEQEQNEDELVNELKYRMQNVVDVHRQKMAEEKKEEEDEDEDEDEDEEIELEEYEHDGKVYYTEDAKNGNLYECLEDGEIGDIIGHLENGSVFFS